MTEKLKSSSNNSNNSSSKSKKGHSGNFGFFLFGWVKMNRETSNWLRFKRLKHQNSINYNIIRTCQLCLNIVVNSSRCVNHWPCHLAAARGQMRWSNITEMEHVWEIPFWATPLQWRENQHPLRFVSSRIVWILQRRGRHRWPMNHCCSLASLLKFASGK